MKGTRTSGERRVLGSGRERERKGKDESETNGRGAQVGARSRGFPYGVTPSTPAGSVPIHPPHERSRKTRAYKLRPSVHHQRAHVLSVETIQIKDKIRFAGCDILQIGHT